MTAVDTGKRVALKNVLFLTDFSEPSDNALPFVNSIARSYGSQVTALHVLIPTAYTNMTPEVSDSILGAEQDQAKEEMARVEAQLAGISCETVIERGLAVWDSLRELLRQRPFDLIVLGTHGRTGLRKLLLGSSAEEVFRSAAVPVLTIGPAVRIGVHNGGRFRCVLFATDFNAVSASAAPYAVSLAQENRARLILLHVLPMPKPGKPRDPAELSVAEALHRLQQLLLHGAELWCRAEPAVEHGEPGARILNIAGRSGTDLIVLGVRGLNTLTEIATRVERAIAYDVVAHAACPVLTVRG